MHRRERAPQSVRVRRHENEVYVIGRKAPRPNRHIGLPAMSAQKLAVQRVIGLAEECAGTTDAALCDVIRMTGNDNASEAGHGP
jgi:hypothetical protein